MGKYSRGEEGAGEKWKNRVLGAKKACKEKLEEGRIPGRSGGSCRGGDVKERRRDGAKASSTTNTWGAKGGETSDILEGKGEGSCESWAIWKRPPRGRKKKPFFERKLCQMDTEKRAV